MHPVIWGSVVLAVIGLFLLCGSENMGIGKGELLTLGCAAAFAFHILYIDRISDRVDGVRLSSMQFFVCGSISAIVMLLFETPNWNAIMQCWLPICYAGILSSGVAYTFQIIGQKHLAPTVASLLMSLESVFATLAGWVVLKEYLSTKELIGCGLVFTAVILTQIPVATKKEQA